MGRSKLEPDFRGSTLRTWEIVVAMLGPLAVAGLLWWMSLGGSPPTARFAIDPPPEPAPPLRVRGYGEE